jgi:hypothetical protein
MERVSVFADFVNSRDMASMAVSSITQASHVVTHALNRNQEQAGVFHSGKQS